MRDTNNEDDSNDEHEEDHAVPDQSEPRIKRVNLSKIKLGSEKNIKLEPDAYSLSYKYTPSTRHGLSTTKGDSIPTILKDGVSWMQAAKRLTNGTSESHLEETKGDSSQFEESALKRGLKKAFGATDSEASIKMRNTQSAQGIKPVISVQPVDSAYSIKPSRPQTTTASKLIKRKMKKSEYYMSSSRYQLNDPLDILADSSESMSEFEDVLEKKAVMNMNRSGQ